MSSPETRKGTERKMDTR
jgi:hypothetical protein